MTGIPWLADDGDGHRIIGGGWDDEDYPGAPDPADTFDQDMLTRDDDRRIDSQFDEREPEP